MIALAWMVGTDGTLAVFLWSFPTLIILWFLYLFGPYAVQCDTVARVSPPSNPENNPLYR